MNQIELGFLCSIANITKPKLVLSLTPFLSTAVQSRIRGASLSARNRTRQPRKVPTRRVATKTEIGTRDSKIEQIREQHGQPPLRRRASERKQSPSSETSAENEIRFDRKPCAAGFASEAAEFRESFETSRDFDRRGSDHRNRWIQR